MNNGKKYDLAGVVYGTGWHATAIVTNSQGSFTICNDSFVRNTNECSAQGSLMAFYTKHEAREEKDDNEAINDEQVFDATSEETQ